MPHEKITNMPAKDALEAGSMALYMQGLLYESATNASPDQAAAAYSKALELNPFNQIALASLVNNLSLRKRYEEAFNALDKNLYNFPKNQNLHLYAVKLADHLQKPAAAAQYCHQILVNDPTNQPIAQAAIQYYFADGKDKKALSTLKQFTKTLDDQQALKFSLETILSMYQSRTNPKQALKCTATALKFAKSNEDKSDVMMIKAYCQLETAQTNNAVRNFKNSYTLNPRNYIPLTHLGIIYANQPHMLHRLEKQSTGKTQQTPPSNLILGHAYNALNQPKKAAEVFEQFYQQRMRLGYFADKKFYLILGSTYEAYKAYEKIDRLFIDAICAYPDDPEILNFAAYLWSEREIKLDKALKCINTVLEQEPDNPAFLDTKGWVLHRLGRDFEALQLLLKACASENNEPVILDHTGDVLNSIGNKILALEFWKKSYVYNPLPSVAKKLESRGEALPKR
jgi:tetratricopeptide (TPR) repeat protein